MANLDIFFNVAIRYFEKKVGSGSVSKFRIPLKSNFQYLFTKVILVSRTNCLKMLSNVWIIVNFWNSIGDQRKGGRGQSVIHVFNNITPVIGAGCCMSKKSCPLAISACCKRTFSWATTNRFISWRYNLIRSAYYDFLPYIC